MKIFTLSILLITQLFSLDVKEIENDNNIVLKEKQIVIEKAKIEKSKKETVKKEKQLKIEKAKIEKSKKASLVKEIELDIEKDKIEKAKKEALKKEKQLKIEKAKIEKAKKEALKKEKQLKIEKAKIEKAKKEALKKEKIKKEKEERKKKKLKEIEEELNKNLILKKIIEDKEILLNNKFLFKINRILSKDIKKGINRFTKLEISQIEINNIKKRIEIYKKNENSLFLTKNKILLLYYDSIKHINFIVSSIIKNKMSKEDMLEYLVKEKNYIEVLKNEINVLNNESHKNIDTTNKKMIILYEETNKALDKLERLIKIYYSYILYLTENYDYIFNKNNIMETLHLSNILDDINNNKNLSSINNFLDKMNVIDAGRIILFILITIISWSFRFLFILFVFPFIRQKLSKSNHNSASVITENLKSIRRPITWTLVLFGIDLGVKVLYFPVNVPLNIIHIIEFLYIFNITYLLLSISNILFSIIFDNADNVKKVNLREEIINLLNQMFKFFIIISALLLFLTKLDVDISKILAGLGIGGMAVAFAAKDTIGNFFGSIKIILDESFSQGNWIASTAAEGTVVEIGLVSTKIRTFDNALVTVPNGILANIAIKNWDRRKIGRRIKLYIGVTYDSNRMDLQKALSEIKIMLSEHKDISQPSYKSNEKKRRGKLVNLRDSIGVKTTQLVYLDEMADSSINILVYTFTQTTQWEKWLQVKEDVLFKIWEILEKNNLEYAFPSQTVYYKNDNKFGNENHFLDNDNKNI